MWQAVQDKLKYYAMASMVFAMGVGVRYVTYWSPAPVDPTRSGAFIDVSVSESPAIVEQTQTHLTWQVPFVTLRRFDAVTGDFVGDGDQLLYGMSAVKLPAYRGRGSLALAPADQPPSDSHVIRLQDDQLEEGAFYQVVRQLVDRSKRRDVLVFVHGFNVTFNEAVCRAAQLGVDMPFDGVMLAFDWNSAASNLGYFRDKQTTQQSAPALAGVLAELRAQLDPDVRIHVLAHSMGNRYLLNALQLLTNYQPLIGMPREEVSRLTTGLTSGLLKPQFSGWELWHPRLGEPSPLTHVVFAAPDVEPATFQSSLPAIGRIAQSMTLYCSESDFALDLSRYVNGQGKSGFRVGDARSGMTRGLDIVRLKGVSQRDPFGHSYYGNHPGLLTDLSLLLQQDLSLPQRPTVIAGTWFDEGKWFLR